MSRFGIGRVVRYDWGNPALRRLLWEEKKRRMEENAQQREIERRKAQQEAADAIKAFQQKGKSHE